MSDNKRIHQIVKLYPAMSLARAEELDKFLVENTDRIFKDALNTRLEGFEPTIVVALQLAYIHNNIEAAIK